MIAKAADGWVSLSDIHEWEVAERPVGTYHEPEVEIAPWVGLSPKEAYHLGLRMGHFGHALALVAKNAPRASTFRSDTSEDLGVQVYMVLQKALAPLSVLEIGRRCGVRGGNSITKIKKHLEELLVMGKVKKIHHGAWAVVK